MALKHGVEKAVEAVVDRLQSVSRETSEKNRNRTGCFYFR